MSSSLFFATTATHKIAKMSSRIRVVGGGTSASKTVSILVLLIQMAQMAGNKEAKEKRWPVSPLTISVVAESLPHLKKAAMRDFLEILNAQKIYKEELWNRTDFIYTFETGSKIEFFGVEDASKVRGPRRDILFVNEANNVSYETFDQLLVRTNNFCYIDFNPVAEFWFHTEVKINRTDWEEITLTYKDNEALSEGVIADIEQHKNRPGWWKVFGLGQLGEIEGKVYSGWGVIDAIPHEARLERYGLDFGFSQDPCALVAIYYYNSGYILDEEFYQIGMKNREIAGFFKNRPRALVVADSAEPKSIAEIKEFGINIVPCVKKGAKGVDYKRYSIQTVQDLKISVTRASANLLTEYRNYLWAVDRDGKIIQNETEGSDHCFAPESLVFTTKGKKRIDELVGKTGFVFTKGGKVERFFNVRATRKDAEVLTIEFEDGEKITVTPDHLLLLPNNNWIEARLLVVLDMIQSVMYESKNSFLHEAKIQWNKLLFDWKVFWSLGYKKKVAPCSVGISQWNYPKRFSYSSQGFESDKQSDRELGSKTQVHSFERTHDSREKGISKETRRKNKTSYQEMAWVKRGDRVAQVAWNRSVQEQKTFRERLCLLPQKIYNYAVCRFSEILSSKLQNESETKTIKRIIRGFRPVTYNLEVENTHCLVVNGVIAHNCLDALRYGLNSLAQVIRRKEILANMSQFFPPRQRKNIAV